LNRYRVVYVGNDSCEHRAVVYAEDHLSALAEAKRKHDVDFVLDVQKASTPLMLAVKAALWLAVLGAATAIAIRLLCKS